MFATDDTIVAISTAAGNAARAIVRLSGPDASRIAAAVFVHPAGRLERCGGFRALAGVVRLASPVAELPARVYVFRAPRSYTRQDVVELHVPGAAAVAAALADALIDAGARQAEPGEFTARAFFSGRIDLSQAEAVADIINAADDAHRRSAMSALGGTVHRLCASAADDLTDALATVEASIDLAEEDIQLDRPGDVARRLDRIARDLRSVAEQAADIPDKTTWPHAVLAGRPNVGKSSLLNALASADRAIVSAMAGTTRDVLSAPLRLGDGAVVILQDAAGFAAPTDGLAAAAGSAARRAVRSADAVLFVADLAERRFGEDLDLLRDVRSTNPRAPLGLLANKLDLLRPQAAQALLDELASRCGLKPMATSAVRGDGLSAVRQHLHDCLHLTAIRAGAALGLHGRQKRHLLAAAGAARGAANALGACGDLADGAELVAIDLRRALAELGAISGQVVTEDILGRIFSRFCVGK
jgi:tRNA modification GTPase